MNEAEIKKLWETSLAIMMSLSQEDMRAMNEDVPPTDKVRELEQICRRVLELDPNDDSALQNLVSLGPPLVSKEERLSLARRRARANPTKQSLYAFAGLLMQDDEFELAIEELDKCQQAKVNDKAPWAEDSIVYYWLAIAKANTGRLHEALDSVDEAIRLADSPDRSAAVVRVRDQVIAALNEMHSDEG